MRQFAWAQMVPDAVDTRLDLHRIQLRGNDNTSWVTQGITRVYIGNLVNRDTRSHGYQPASVDRRMMEVDDMASVAIREPPSSPSHMAAVMKKVQTIIRRCMVSNGPSCRRPREHVLDRGARGVKRGARRHPGHGAGGGRQLPRQTLVDPGRRRCLPRSMNNDEEMWYLWTISAEILKEGIHILVEFEPIEQQNIPSIHDRNTTTLPEHITT
ncbi:hypothetical protein M9H77_04442 [Catharanthus roseus]|uniref:Uncharacterized protein n=1 Tax=Catharanthus roseus TaxID=4058 RepID=A0ACC0CEA1_CATRO|nr:hypothetical protein M9H77_04442 [Catharanthus roseus]